jgi:hypothetical protein
VNSLPIITVLLPTPPHVVLMSGESYCAMFATATATRSSKMWLMPHANAGTWLARYSLLIAFLAFPNRSGGAITRLCSNIECEGYWPTRNISHVSITTAPFKQSAETLITVRITSFNVWDIQMFQSACQNNLMMSGKPARNMRSTDNNKEHCITLHLVSCA